MRYDSNGNPIIDTLGIDPSNLGAVNTRSNLAQGYDNAAPKSAVYSGGVAPAGTDVSGTNNAAGYLNPYTEYSNQEGLFGLTNGYWNNIGQASGLAGTAYNLYDSILGNKAQMFDTQMKAMKQNMANVKEDRAAHKTFQNNIGSGFNSAMGSGLAANSIKVG